jgi:hypothetical protein
VAAPPKRRDRLAPQYDKTVAGEVPWERFLDGLHPSWEEGQHVSALGRTGGGKTTALVQLLDGRRNVVALLTKLRDPLFETLPKRGYKVVRSLDEWPDRDWHPKVALHIPSTSFDRKGTDAQAKLIRRVLHKVWRDGHTDLYVDEIAELTDLLNLKLEMRALYKEARSSGVAIIAGTQRPAWVPKEMYSQPRFLMFWRTSDRAELLAMASMNGVDPEPVRAVVAQLDNHEVLAVDTLSGEMIRTRPPKIK